MAPRRQAELHILDESQGGAACSGLSTQQRPLNNSPAASRAASQRWARVRNHIENSSSSAATSISLRVMAENDGVVEHVDEDEIQELRLGAVVLKDLYWKVTLDSELPTWMQGVKYFPARATHFTCTNPGYLTAKFACDIEPMILVLKGNYNTNTPPTWLREQFARVRSSTASGADGSSLTELKLAWNGGFGSKAVYSFMSFFIKSRMRQGEGNNLVVWRRRLDVNSGAQGALQRVLPAGQPLILGGPCVGAQMTYILCWQEVGPGQGHLGGLEEPEAVPWLRDPQLVTAALITAVGDDDIQGVTNLVEKQGADVGIVVPRQLRLGSSMLLSGVAAEKYSMHMLCYLLHQGAPPDLVALRFLIDHPADILPEYCSGSLQEVLVTLLLQHPNPVSVCYAIWKTLQDANKQAGSGIQSSEIRSLAIKFHRVAIDLVEMLESLEALGSAECTRRQLPSLDDVLSPNRMGDPSVSDLDVTAIALEAHDIEYFATSAVSSVMKTRWIGQDYKKVALAEMPWEEVSQTNHDWLVKFLESAGMGTPATRWMMQLPFHLWHCYAHGSRFFYDSPRGRWLMAFMALLAFMALHHYILLEELLPLRDFSWPAIVLTVFTLSFIIDQVYEISTHTRTKLLSFSFVIDSLLNLLLVAVLAVRAAIWLGMLDDTSFSLVTILLASSSVPLWIRALGMITPLHKQFGPLFYVINLMMLEVLLFMVPFCFLLAGVSFMVHGIYQNYVQEFQSVPNTMLFFFRIFLGDFNFDVFDAAEDLDATYTIVGKIIIVAWTVVSAVALANLLIAILSFKYRPDDIEPESAYQQAIFLQHWQQQVDTNWAGAPFSVIQVCLFWMGGSTRIKIQSSTFRRGYLCLPFDGSSAIEDFRRFPTGKAELGYLGFLLTVYPVLWVSSCALAAMLLPLVVLTFAFQHSASAVSVQQRGIADTYTLASIIASRAAARPPSAVTGIKRRNKNGVAAAAGALVEFLELLWTLIRRLFWVVLLSAIAFLLYGLLVVFVLTAWSGVYNWVARVAFHLYWFLVGGLSYGEPDTSEPKVTSVGGVVDIQRQQVHSSKQRRLPYCSEADLQVVIENAGLRHGELVFEAGLRRRSMHQPPSSYPRQHSKQDIFPLGSVPVNTLLQPEAVVPTVGALSGSIQPKPWSLPTPAPLSPSAMPDEDGRGAGGDRSGLRADMLARQVEALAAMQQQLHSQMEIVCKDVRAIRSCLQGRR